MTITLLPVLLMTACSIAIADIQNLSLSIQNNLNQGVKLKVTSYCFDNASVTTIKDYTIAAGSFPSWTLPEQSRSACLSWPTLQVKFLVGKTSIGSMNFNANGNKLTLKSSTGYNITPTSCGSLCYNIRINSKK